MKLYRKLLCTISTVFLLIHQLNALPDLSQTSREPVITIPGADAYLSCKVKDLGNHTVLFRKLDSLTTDLEGDLLTVGNLSLRDDNRYQILHERRHDIWLLKIKNVTEDDSGIYICEVNSKPKRKITRLLKIVKESPLVNTESLDEDGSPPIALHEISHNYSDCCIANNVPTGCLDYCEFSQLVQNNKQGGNSLSSRMCFNHIGSITKCLTDGRNHLPCCIENHIPKVCQPICMGNFSLTAVTDYFTCMDVVAPILACVGKGIKVLPPRPVDLIVEPNTESLIVKWTKPIMDSNLINHYLLNVTQLHSFDDQQVRNRVMSNEQDKKINNNKNSTDKPSMYGLQLSYKVNGSLTEFHLFNLKPFTIYEIIMSSHNKFGSSLPTEIVRTVTLASDSKPQISQNRSSNRNSTDNGTTTIETTKTKNLLPDVKGCCKKAGVAIGRCLDIMCDPVRADETTLTDIMICAPYANVTFKCMANHVDHRPCCLNKGVPSLCSSFCDGEVKKLDFRHFICLRHMSSYQSCILDHYGVLPSEPIDFHVTSVHHNWAILRWKVPSKNNETVKEYHIYYRESLKDKPNIFNRSVTQFSPFLLDGLNANSRYEVYVSAVNSYGIGSGSNRVIFFTPAIVEISDDTITTNNKDIILDKNNQAYNETECCINAKLAKHCMPLCSYQMKITDVLNLAPKCGDQMSALVRCGTGGRNHIPCCQRRAVSESCLNLCAGIVETSPMVIARSCSSDQEKIFISECKIYIRWQSPYINA